MRITNSIMVNNNLSNINKNKAAMDKIMTQIATTKKIQRPSDDPIAAIRALRLRSTFNEIEQYKERNVEDATAWMQTTADALTSATDTLENIVYYCNQGVNTYETTEEYEAIIDVLKQYREAIYKNGNADYGDRTLFTGYKTDTTLTFVEVDNFNVSYDIRENHKFDDIETLFRTVGVNMVDTLGGAGNNSDTNDTYVGTDVKNHEMKVLRLAYKDIEADAANGPGVTITYTDENGAEQTITPVIKHTQTGENVYKDMDADKVYIVPETGELIFGKDVYDDLVKKEFTVDYTKSSFVEGDLKPEHYFDCVKTEIVGQDENGTDIKKVVQYTKKDQNINYTVSFNQEITINVQAQDVFKHEIGRDIDEIVERLDDMVDVMNKMSEVEKRIANTIDPDTKTNYEEMYEALQVEFGYIQENLKNSFADGIKKFKEHQKTVSVEVSDLAARMDRLSMIGERLNQQSLTVEELKSKNEDTKITDAAVEYNAMNDVYEASLSTAAKIVQQSLLDFL